MRLFGAHLVDTSARDKGASDTVIKRVVRRWVLQSQKLLAHLGVVLGSAECHEGRLFSPTVNALMLIESEAVLLDRITLALHVALPYLLRSSRGHEVRPDRALLQLLFTFVVLSRVLRSLDVKVAPVL